MTDLKEYDLDRPDAELGDLAAELIAGKSAEEIDRGFEMTDDVMKRLWHIARMRALKCRGSDGDADSEYLKSVVEGDDEETQAMLRDEAEYYGGAPGRKKPDPVEAPAGFEYDGRDDDMIRGIADSMNLELKRQSETDIVALGPEDDIDFTNYLKLT